MSSLALDNQLFYADGLAEITQLLEDGANPSACHRNGETALAFYLHDPEIVKVLLAYGAHVNFHNYAGDSYLHITDSPAIAEILIKEGHIALDHRNQIGATALLKHGHHAPMVKLLLAYGASPDLQDVLGQTIMHKLLFINPPFDFNRRLDTAQLLLDYHADSDVADLQGVTPFQLATNMAGIINNPKLSAILTSMTSIRHQQLDRQLPASAPVDFAPPQSSSKVRL